MSAKWPTGEYRQFVHTFEFIERFRPDNPGVSIGEHFSYPWPAPCKPTIEYIDSVFLMTHFQHWPHAWAAFWAELALLGYNHEKRFVVDESTGTARRAWCDAGNYSAERRGGYYPQPNTRHGPYMMLYPALGVEAIASRVVGIKRQVRASLPNGGRVRSSTDEILQFEHDEIVRRVLTSFEQFRVHVPTEERKACESSTS